MINPFNFVTTASRHMLDVNVTFGLSGSRFPMRDMYRREYTPDRRLAAGLGTAAGAALPALGLVAWATQKGLKVPLAPTGMLGSTAGKAVGVAVAGAATAAGIHKLVQITEDDGHAGAAGSAAGIVAGAIGGYVLGNKFAGKFAPLVVGAGAIAGGIAGYKGGEKYIKVGEGNIGKEHVIAPQVDRNGLDRATSFGRGAFIAFSETGPASQGMSFGYAWKMDETFKTKMSNAERSGVMHGDLLAAGLLGGGALAVAGGLMKGGPVTGALAANKMLAAGSLTRNLSTMQNLGAAGIGAAALGIAASVAMKERAQWSHHTGSDAIGNAAAGAVLATGAGAALLASKSPAFAGMAAAPKAASSLITGIALVAALSAARLPIQQFISDARKAHEVSDSNLASGAIAGATGAGVAGYGAFKLASSMVPEGGVSIGKFHLSKGMLVGVGTAIGVLSGAGTGYGLSATMPGPLGVAIGTGTGAAAGAAAGFLLKGVGMKAGIAAGALTGMAASSLLRDDSAAKQLTTIDEDRGPVDMPSDTGRAYA